MTQIKDIMIDLNPWWKEPFSLEYHEREIYANLQKFIPLPQIIAMTGLRRVGKTTLMHKIVEDTINKGFDPGNILFFSFDEFKNIDIRDLIWEYEKLMKKDFRKNNYLLLLDEIQKLDRWEDQLKGIYDIFKGKVKIIISGSESLFLKKKSKETLNGRLFDFRIDLLSFKEFLHFKQVDFKPIGLYEKELSKLFDEFVLSAGFPEMVGIKEKEVIKKYIRESIVKRVIYWDIPAIYDIKDVSVLESLVNIIMEEPGQLLELTELGKELKITRQTVSNYLRYLQESFLVKKIYNFSRSRRISERKLKKFYPSIISVNLLFKEDPLFRSKVFEWLVVTQLKAEFFWRDAYKNEVDMILGDEQPIPVEIKYGKLNYKGLMAFMRAFNLKEGYIVSYESELEKKINGNTIRVIPAFKFLLNPGNYFS